MLWTQKLKRQSAGRRRTTFFGHRRAGQVGRGHSACAVLVVGTLYFTKVPYFTLFRVKHFVPQYCGAAISGSKKCRHRSDSAFDGSTAQVVPQPYLVAGHFELGSPGSVHDQSLGADTIAMSLTCRYVRPALRATRNKVRQPRPSPSCIRWQSSDATPAAITNPKISTIVDSISQLTLLETADLVSSLKVSCARRRHVST